jgi:hypothetical protein
MRAFIGKFACLVFLVAGMSLGLTACAGELSADSSCQDFMEASPEDQASAISKLSSEFETPDIATPLGSPSIAYSCADEPDTSLGEVFQRYQD